MTRRRSDRLGKRVSRIGNTPLSARIYHCVCFWTTYRRVTVWESLSFAAPLPPLGRHQYSFPLEFPLPRREIQRAFLSWLEENRGCLVLDITLGKRTDTVQEYLRRVNPVISGALTTYEIEVWAIHRSYRR
jgi:hypothetical protein